MVFFLKYVHIYQYKERQTLEWIHSQTPLLHRKIFKLLLF